MKTTLKINGNSEKYSIGEWKHSKLNDRKNTKIVKNNSIENTAQCNVLKSLIDILRGNDPSKRRDAAFDLGRLSDLGALYPLIEALKDTDTDVRSSVIKALVVINDLRAVPHLVNATYDSNPSIADEAVMAIFEISYRNGYFILKDAWADINNNYHSKRNKAMEK
jgi:HEAT repeat protein